MKVDDVNCWTIFLGDVICEIFLAPLQIDGGRFMTNNVITLLSNLVKSLVAQFGNIVVFYKVISFGLSIY